MISAQGLLDRIQKNVGVPWQGQRSDGFSDGILFGNSEATVTGIVTTYIPSLQVLKRAVDSGKNLSFSCSWLTRSVLTEPGVDVVINFRE